VTGKRVLLILGGMFHDFEGFAAAIRPVIAGAGYSLTATYDLDELARLGGGAYDIVLSDTSLSRHREGMPATTPQTFTPEQTAGLERWVRDGGALVGVHSATVSGVENPAFLRLLGGRFLSHPPQFVFTVSPVFGEHPITAGIEAFTVKDEMYIQECDPSIRVHMVTVDRGVAYPMVWSRLEGKGRVAHVSMGHGPEVWALPQFQRLILQSLAWTSEARG
jgi:type 1 glutamine amidotransferase